MHVLRLPRTLCATVRAKTRVRVIRRKVRITRNAFRAGAARRGPDVFKSFSKVERKMNLRDSSERRDTNLHLNILNNLRYIMHKRYFIRFGLNFGRKKMKFNLRYRNKKFLPLDNVSLTSRYAIVRLQLHKKS